MTSEAQTLSSKLKKAEDTLSKAENLLGKLTDEKDRWNNQLNEIESQFKNLPIDSLLCAAFCTYLSDMDEKKRLYYQNGWSRVVGGRKVDFCSFSYGESTFLKWKSEGLPSDSLSLENTIIYYTTPKTPMIIDPSSKFNKWLKHTKSEEKNFESIFIGHQKFQMH